MGEDIQMSVMWEKALYNGKLIWEQPEHYGLFSANCSGIQELFVVKVNGGRFAGLAAHLNLPF